MKIRVAIAIGVDGMYSACAENEHGSDYNDAMEAACVWLMERGGTYVLDRFWLTTERVFPSEPPEVKGGQE